MHLLVGNILIIRCYLRNLSHQNFLRRLRELFALVLGIPVTHLHT